MKPRKIIPTTGMLEFMTLILLCLAQSATAQGNLVYNGGFGISSNGVTPDGWTLVGNCYYDTKFGNPTPCIQFDVGTASQTITGLTSGGRYVVSGDYEALQISYDFGVTIDGTNIGNLTSPNANWQSFSFFYTASSSSVILGLNVSEIEGNIVFVADNIAMYTVPEPSVWSLILLGSGVLIYVRSRIRR